MKTVSQFMAHYVPSKSERPRLKTSYRAMRRNLATVQRKLQKAREKGFPGFDNSAFNGEVQDATQA